MTWIDTAITPFTQLQIVGMDGLLILGFVMLLVMAMAARRREQAELFTVLYGGALVLGLYVHLWLLALGILVMVVNAFSSKHLDQADIKGG